MLNFKLNNEYLTAIITGVEMQAKDIYIPHYAFSLNGAESSKKYIITKIDQSSFYSNKSIRTVSFSRDSEIQEFGCYAFSNSSLEYISIPKQVSIIENGCFSECKKLKKVDITEDSNLVYLGKKVFDNSSIESFYFPKKLKEIDQSIFLNTSKLSNILVSPENEYFSNYKNEMIISKKDNHIVFVQRNIEELIIPSFINQINSYSFHLCKKLKSVEFEPDSKLSCIELNAFLDSSLSTISFPASLRNFSLAQITNLKYKTLEFLGNNIECSFDLYSENLLFMSFPNCDEITIHYYYDYSKYTFFIAANAHIDAYEEINCYGGC